LPILKQSIAIRPTYEAYSNLGTAYFARGRFADAVSSYEQAVKLNDHIYDAWGNLGDAYYWAPHLREKAAGAYRQAVALALKEREVNPRDASLLGYIAQYYAMLGEKAPAMDYIRQALRLNPKGAETALSAATVYNQFGDSNSAVNMLKRAMQGGISPSTVRTDPEFSNLVAESRLRDLLRAR
jgi:eukaryotic-like serine/threonine-protein kinase